jgi:hypothetical protein
MSRKIQVAALENGASGIYGANIRIYDGKPVADVRIPLADIPYVMTALEEIMRRAANVRLDHPSHPPPHVACPS